MTLSGLWSAGLVAIAMGAALRLSSSPCAAAPAAVGRAEVVRALSECRKITEDSARLSCFDKAAGALDQAESQGQVVVIDQAQVATVRRQAFGFSMPSLNIFAKSAPKSGEGVDHLHLVVASAHQDGGGHWLFTSEDGAVWRQTDESEFAVDPKKGSALFVESGVLGSYFCKINSLPHVRCARVN